MGPAPGTWELETNPDGANSRRAAPSPAPVAAATHAQAPPLATTREYRAMQWIYYIGVLGPLGRREHSEMRAAKPHVGISSQ
jgi:hypothetical protein